MTPATLQPRYPPLTLGKLAAESLKKPLSDNQISEMLKEQGIECARRTVAKYREALRIAPANLRKAL